MKQRFLYFISVTSLWENLLLNATGHKTKIKMTVATLLSATLIYLCLVTESKVTIVFHLIYVLFAYKLTYLNRNTRNYFTDYNLITLVVWEINCHSGTKNT